MTQRYPIIEAKALDPVGKARLLGLGTRRRDWGEIPRPRAEQAQVYIVDGRHVVDHGRLGPDDETVVRATHVSVVDLTRDRSVSVEVTIPSKDDNHFTVRVEFLCTVLEPEKVVRTGQGDAAVVLLGYVRRYKKLFNLGLEHELPAVNQVRLLVQTQLEAYYQHVRPDTPGMRVQLASIEVPTPPELENLGKDRFGVKQGGITDALRADVQFDVDSLRARHAEELALLQKRYELQLAEQQYSIDASRQVARHRLTDDDNRFAAQQAAELRASIGNDPWRADLFALAKGEGSAAQIAAGMHDAQADAEARRRELEDRQAEIAHDELRRTWATAERDAGWSREDQRQAVEARLDLLKELAKHGHLDEVSIDEIDGFMDRLVGRPGQGRLGASADAASELDAPDTAGVAGRDAAALPDDGGEPDDGDESFSEDRT
ncbi:hypothetical protein [Actinomadura opuntiae]|uniref:hypothetical protein n=1 Tax=Actinomadura sp. OS1-43 TaxID=604315 RepID=UPI00255B31C1|nr:hypothetical protein [Actinomadura sp. OS1-43]MDL4815148.1 hypothetical protein [Actinomadura sp. OS1-43]